MYARVSEFWVDPGKLDEVIRIVRENLAPATRQFPGFKGGLLLTDPSTGKCLGVSLWETKEQMLASASNDFFRAMVSSLVGVVAGAAAHNGYEVSIRE